MRILVAISHHGLGHLAQAAPIINALDAHRPGLQWLIWSGLPESALAARLDIAFARRGEAADVGLAMRDAMRVDSAASAAAYRAFHADWAARVAREARWLRDQQVDAVLADAAYLPLAAAAQAGIPAVAFCSLNWRDILAAYLADQPGMAPILEQIAAAYAAARAFLRLTPAMPMAWLAQRETLPPVAAQGRQRRDELNGRLHLPRRRKLVLVGFGGIAYPGRASLPELADTSWLVPDDWLAPGRADLVGWSRGEMPFLDLLASCDALVTKTGYGSFVEAALHAIPVLYLDRPDWPESPYLCAWLRQHGRADAIGEHELFSRAVGTRLAHLWNQPAKPAVNAPGAAAAAQRILQLLA